MATVARVTGITTTPTITTTTSAGAPRYLICTTVKVKALTAWLIY
nr:MAG TPA: hypothetical protein [Caudoviricetes sp.]